LGIKTEEKSSAPAYYVPKALKESGMRIIPVPVYHPEATHILDEPVVRDLKALNQKVDIVDVFRRPPDLPAHLEDILAMNPPPGCVWLQSGISNPDFEQRLVKEGIPVVVSRCLMVDRAAAGGHSAL
jgi:uncharacterized protein